MHLKHNKRWTTHTWLIIDTTYRMSSDISDTRDKGSQAGISELLAYQFSKSLKFIWRSFVRTQNVHYSNVAILSSNKRRHLDVPWKLGHSYTHGPLARYGNLRVRMRRECRERFPRHLVLPIPKFITARAWRTCRDACHDRYLAVSF